MNRAERRRKERAEAKLFARIDRSYRQADGVRRELAPMLHRMRNEAVRSGWGDVVGHMDLALDALASGEGLRLQHHMNDAAKAIDAHQPPES